MGAGLHQGGNRNIEFEDVSAEVEWEARRVAAAINADEFRLVHYRERTFPNISHSSTGALYHGLWGSTQIRWTLDVQSLSLQSLRVGDPGVAPVDACQVYRIPVEATGAGTVWSPWATMPQSLYTPRVLFKEHVARTLYRLGIDMEDEDLLAPLNVSLSAHEKAELRLSLPREFWPQTWLQEERA